MGKNGWKKKGQQKGVKEEEDKGNLGILENFDKQNLVKPTVVENKGNVYEMQ